MDKILGVCTAAAIAYGNYFVFQKHAQALFWALSCNSIWRRSGLTGGILCIIISASIPLICTMCIEELIECAAQINKLGMFGTYADSLLKWIIQHGEEKTCCNSVDLLIKIEEYLKEWGQRHISSIGVFIGACTCLSIVEGAPISYLVRHLNCGPEIARLFDDLVRALIMCSAKHFLAGLCIGVILSSPFAICGGVCAAFLSSFPFAPIFIYSAPGSALLWMQGKYFVSVLGCICALLQGILLRKGGSARGMSPSLRVLGTGAGMRAFGPAGAILGPFFLGSAVIILKNHPQPDSNLTKTARVKHILRKA